MKYILILLGWVAVIMAPASAQGVQAIGQNTLVLAIVPTKDKSGASVIEHHGVFSVVFSNRSAKPIRLWSEYCQFGYETLSFRVEDGNGQSARMYKVARCPSDWKNQPPQTVTIPPGRTFSWKVVPSGIWGEREWKGVPELNTGKTTRLTAIFEIKPTEAAQQHGVWTGRVTSAPVETFVVDPKLRTPHEYLWADCPKQALRIIQADPTWVGKRDKDQRTPLHLAARFGFGDVVRWLLAHGADINATASNCSTPLHFAHDPEMVKLLLEHKAAVNAKDSSGRTALEEAASDWAHCGRYPDYRAERDRWWAITKILLDAGAEYDIRSACYLGDVARVRVLLKDKKQARDKEALRWAATYGRTQIVKLFLEQGADLEDAGYGGLTVSYFAIEHADVLKLLFDAGADPKTTVQYEGNAWEPPGSTLLHAAVEKGALESAKLLLTRGLSVNAATPSGATPLHVACGQGHATLVEWLLQNKANAKARTKDGWTPMALAASEVRPEAEEDNARFQAVIRALERAGVEVDVFAAVACNDVRRVATILRSDPKCGERKNAAGCPALHRAVMLDRKEIVKAFLDHGCDPDIRSEDGSGYVGETALLEAAFCGRLEIAEMLIERHANVKAKAERGITPLHEAARLGHFDLARLLLKQGADIHAKDDKGKTPLDWAKRYREVPGMIKLLRSHGGQSKEP
jgi:cytohesin